MSQKYSEDNKSLNIKLVICIISKMSQQILFYLYLLIFITPHVRIL